VIKILLQLFRFSIRSLVTIKYGLYISIYIDYISYLVFVLYTQPYILLDFSIEFPSQAWTGPEGSRKLRFLDFVKTAQDGGRLSALRTGRLLGTYFC